MTTTQHIVHSSDSGFNRIRVKVVKVTALSKPFPLSAKEGK